MRPLAALGTRLDFHWLRVTEGRDLLYFGGGATKRDFFGYGGSAAGGAHETAYVVELTLTYTLNAQPRAPGLLRPRLRSGRGPQRLRARPRPHLRIRRRDGIFLTESIAPPETDDRDEADDQPWLGPDDLAPELDPD